MIDYRRITVYLAVISLAFSAFFMVYDIQEASGAPGDLDDPLSSNFIGDFSVSPGYAFNTSNQSIVISWSWPLQWAENTHPFEVFIRLRNSPGMMDEKIMYWNLSHGALAPSSYSWDLDNDLPVSANYIFNMTAIAVYEGDDPGNDTPIYYRDQEEAHFRIENGIPLIEGIFSDRMAVDNSGLEYVNLSFHFRRNVSDLDLGEFEFGFFNVDVLEWVDIDLVAATPENQTQGPDSWAPWTHVSIPEDIPVGAYNIYFIAADIWGYKEVWNRSIFSVILKQLPPVLINESIHIDEDSEFMLDLDLIFEDPNGDELTFDINSSGYENISVTLDNTTLRIVPAPDWFGNASITILVNDSHWGFLPYSLNVIVSNVNDLPHPLNDTIIGNRDSILVVDLNEFFFDVDGPGPMQFEVLRSGPNITYEYNSTTYELYVQPDAGFVGETNITIRAHDGLENATYDIALVFQWTFFYVTGSVIFQNAETHLVNLTEAQKKVVLSFTGVELYELEIGPGENYTMKIKDGAYTLSISLNLPEHLLYNGSQRRSGYQIPDMTSLTVNGNIHLPMMISWKVYIPVAAGWDDIDFDNDLTVKESGLYTFRIPVKDGSKTGYDSIPLRMVIINDAEKNDTVSFPFIWNDTAKEYVVKLTGSDLETIKKGALQYYFTDGTHETERFQLTFVEEDKVEANIMTIAILVILIVLVLIALVFIMRKPAEEEDEMNKEE